jgi:hypothetical protein
MAGSRPSTTMAFKGGEAFIYVAGLPKGKS